MKEDYQISKKRLILLYQTIKVRKVEGVFYTITNSPIIIPKKNTIQKETK